MPPKVGEKAFASIKREELPECLSAVFLTWNVGNAPPPEDFTELFGPRPAIISDLILIGLQECSYTVDAAAPADAAPGEPSATAPKAKKAIKAGKQSHFVETACRFFGEEYVNFIAQEFGQMKLVGFVKQILHPHFYDVTSSKEATGLFRVVSNKGGIAACFTIGDTKFAVIASHLNAHAGEEKRKLRHKDTREIFKGTQSLAETKADLPTACHHVFWMGDLNYRMDLQNVLEAVPEAHEEKWKIVHSWVTEKNWGDLYKADELRADMAAGKVLAGFQEGDMSFPPTFKVLREAELKYLDQRVPAYCDRILWCSLPNVAENVEQVSLAPLTHVGTSDHKPVLGTFNIRIHKNPYPPLAEEPLYLRFTELKGANLQNKDLTGLSDPYVWIYSADGVLKETSKKKACTAHKNDTLDPTWDPAKDIPVLEVTQGIEGLRLSTITLLVYDKDIDADDYLGAVAISLASVSGIDEETTFHLPVHRRGVVSGTLTGKFVITPSKKAK